MQTARNSWQQQHILDFHYKDKHKVDLDHQIDESVLLDPELDKVFKKKNLLNHKYLLS